MRLLYVGLDNTYIVRVMSELLKDFADAARRRFSVADTALPVSDWLEQNVVLKGRPFTTAKYAFQRQILDDTHPNLTCIKLSQIGLTTVMIAKSLAFIKRNRGVTAMYTMPSEDLFKKFSQSRLRPFFDENTNVFGSEDIKKPVLNANLVQIETSFLHITGTTEGDATSTPADALFHDEVDLMDQDLRSLFQSRLQNSSHKITQKFSTPTHEGFGIDADFAVSDQNEYICPCSHCNHVNIPDFTRNFVRIPGLPDDIEHLHHLTEDHLDVLDLDNSYVVCEKCRKALDLSHPKREWVAARPSRSSLYRGYRVRPFSTNTLDIKYIVTQLFEYKRRGKLRRWYNTVLGKAFTEAGTRLTREDLFPAFVNPDVPQLSLAEPCFIGIDQGLVSHIVVVSPSKGVIRFETEPADTLCTRVDALRKLHNIVGGAVDRHPFTPTANALRDMTNAVILPVEYRGAAEIRFVKDELGNLSHVQAERTSMIDATVKMIRNKSLKFFGYGHQQDTIITHLTDMVRDEEADNGLPRWLKTKGDDHYHHALAFALVAMRIHEVKLAKDESDQRTSVAFLGADFTETPSGLLVPNRRALFPNFQGIF